jgi:ribonuclease HII
MDEVGRGAWAGPLTVGVAVMTRGIRKFPRGLRDSKQLAEPVREELFTPVGKWCAAWSVGHSSSYECDSLGMTRALRLAARRAFAALPADAYPDAVVLDGSFNFLSRRAVVPEAEDQPEFHQDEMITDDPRITTPAHSLCDELDEFGLRYGDLLDVTMPDGKCPEVRTVIKGDDACASVAAASVLAKVTRDRIMRADAACYPPFDFEHNKGYPTPTHKVALRGYGLTAIHRRSWAFVDWLPLGTSWRPDSSADTGSPESLSPDSGSPETLSPDSGSPETLSPDSGSPETLSRDSGSPETLGDF